MTIQKEFVLRYRSKGHVRFQIPERACRASFASILEERIQAIKGVVKAQIYTKHGKLSIRFDETILSFRELAKLLFTLLNVIENEEPLSDKVDQTSNFRLLLKSRLTDKIQTIKAGRWFSRKYMDAKETLQAAKVITKLGMKSPKAFVQDPERAIINLLNDILIVYLIKTHWRRIIQQWLPNPFKHRYEWLAVWYLMFLLVRSRKTK
jgi:hypothetical protein